MWRPAPHSCSHEGRPNASQVQKRAAGVGAATWNFAFPVLNQRSTPNRGPFQSVRRQTALAVALNPFECIPSTGRWKRERGWGGGGIWPCTKTQRIRHDVAGHVPQASVGSMAGTKPRFTLMVHPSRAFGTMCRQQAVSGRLVLWLFEVLKMSLALFGIQSARKRQLGVARQPKPHSGHT